MSSLASCGISRWKKGRQRCRCFRVSIALSDAAVYLTRKQQRSSQIEQRSEKNTNSLAMEDVPDWIALSMILCVLDHVARCRFAAVNRKHCRWACQSSLLRSVLEFGPRTEDHIALLEQFGQTRIELRFPQSFNQSVDQLPAGITRLTFGKNSTSQWISCLLGSLISHSTGTSTGCF